MQKTITKGMSVFLAFLLVLSVLPNQLVVSVAAAAYEVLIESVDVGGVANGTYENTAVVWEKIYYDPISGKQSAEYFEGSTHPHYLAQYTTSGIKKITDWYPYMSGFSESGHAVISSPEGKDGIINAKGEVVFSPDFEYIDPDSITQDGYVVTRDDNYNYVLLDLSKGTSTPLSHIDADHIYEYNDGRLRVSDHGKYRYVTLEGTPAFSGEYVDALPFCNGYAIVREAFMDNQIIDTSGKVILSEEDKEYNIYYGSVSTEGLVWVFNDDYEDGYIGLDGNYVILPQFERAATFLNRFAQVKNSDWDVGIIDISGNVVIPYGQYEAFTNASSTGVIWATDKDGNLSVLRVGNGVGSSSVPSGPSAPSESNEYIYNTTDSGTDTKMDAERLNNVTNSTTATEAVRDMVNGMTQAQKDAPTGIDLATLYAETAVSRAASKAVSGADILINRAAVIDLEDIAKQTSAAVESALVNGGVSTARYISNVITLTTEETGEISIRIDPDILTTEVDKVVVEAPTYAITLKVSDFKEDLTQILTITAQDVGSGFAPGSSNAKATVKVNLPNGKTSNSVTLSLPKASGDTTYQTVVNTSGTATSSKYNPATTAIDGKVNTSGSYTVQTNQTDFTDISNKSAEMQTAIRYLAARGIIGGTGGTNYSPDDSITRAQIAALVIRALGKVDEGAKPTFKDVTTNNWYYSTAAVSQKAGIINGYEDNTYKGDNQILKEQIVAIAARVLKNEMGYKEPSNTSSYLSKYSDSVAGWAQPEVALATRENIVVYRTDGTFSGSKGMTRGDAAIIIYRLFQRIW